MKGNKYKTMNNCQKEYTISYTPNGNPIIKHEDCAEVLITYKGEKEKIRVYTQIWLIKWFKLLPISYTIRSGKPVIKFGREDANSEFSITKICSKSNPYKTPTENGIYDFRNIITDFNPTNDFKLKYDKYITKYDYERKSR